MRFPKRKSIAGDVSSGANVAPRARSFSSARAMRPGYAAGVDAILRRVPEDEAPALCSIARLRDGIDVSHSGPSKRSITSAASASSERC